MSRTIAAVVGAGVVIYGYQKITDMMKKIDKDQHVVIVGGGYGGAKLAYCLKGRGNVTLIDQRDALHHNMAALRAAVELNFAPKCFIPYKQVFGDDFVQGKVVDIDTKNQEVILENGLKRIPYTELVIATGTSGPFPGKSPLESSSSELMKRYTNYTREIKMAKNVVIVGGGAVGVELAGEIAGDYPGQKKITIVHNNDVLVAPVLTEEARKIIKDKLDEKKVDVLMGDKVTNMDEIPVNKTSDMFQVKLASGKTLDADLVIPCFGLSVNTGAYKNSLGDFMNAKGQLIVNDKLQVKGFDNVFAIGDCNDFNCTKLALVAKEQAEWTFKNLINVGKGKPLQSFRPGGFKMCVPVGRDGGITQVETKVFGDFLTKYLKAKDGFVKFIWKEYGQKPPQ